MTPDERVFQAILHEQLAAFTETAFQTILPGDPYLPNWHMDAIAHVLEGVLAGRIKRLVITMPPRCAKSITASVAFPAWILGRDPTRRIICLSYAQDLSVKLSNQCRSVMTSPWYRQNFPGTVLNPRKNTEAEFETTSGGWRMATSVGGTLTGRGANIIVIDDPIKPSDAMSDTIRSSANDWIDLTLFSRLDDKNEGAIVLVMQRVHVDDLAGHFLERGGWTHLNLPAIAEADEKIPVGIDHLGRPQFHRRRVNDVLHPAREPRERLHEMKAVLGTQNFAAQYQQQPVPVGGNMIDWRWFGRFIEAPVRRHDDALVQSWDTASKTGDLNDYSVCTTWLIRDEDFHLLHVHRERLDAPSLRRRMIELYDRFRPEGVIIEDKASGTAMIQELRESTSLPIIPFEPKGDKVMRASAQSIRIEGGQVWIPANAPWLDEFEREVLAFPNGRYDDQVDSMVQIMSWRAESERNAPRIRFFD